ncbi:DNA polymerase III subunit gamma and tau [Corynebacterium urealyticum]|uniref:DNA polymerase III subunit gamma/tau n=1 Tax=Corynebacterium urealyticum (strain ATCC 43042 / DSM 7109) TaxID=504474 RepID=B1VIS6_CORU7|nr:DNA polymerase III subunit gamma and tau [Corynebacterium urealyticum]QQC42580.1 DNA polymerase III subunit gamma and tau [Corynebacterium urealyticum]CAQ05872.1 DNA polymerase III, gamma and tau subunits [Corynebacterium urealyticum DSM 7109]SNV91812.1 DNA polymerase III subunits gamma and tau [Corynebacterium urealyticum]
MALYRKYRPASFAEVVGQEHVTEPLSVALDSGRINHAYLFSGPRGCGKTSSARILARSLNCVEGPTSTPCGKCDSCIALAPGGPGSLDVTELDAASHRGVDDMRELRDRAFYAPADSRYRVFIIDEAHMITTEGFNTLLKIVEEPPEHLIFIFATTEPEKLLATIRSRTHNYPFRLLTPPDMRGLLGRIVADEGAVVEDAVYPLVVRAGGGSPRDSLSIMDQLLAGAGPEGVTYQRAVALLGVTDSSLLDRSAEALAAQDQAGLFAVVDDVINAGYDPRRFAMDLLDRFRDLLVVQAVPDAFERGLVDVPAQEQDALRQQAEALGPATLTRCAAVVNDGLSQMRGATSPRLLLEILCARMALPAAGMTVEALAQRVEALEQGTGVRAAGPMGASGGLASPAVGAGASPTGDASGLSSGKRYERPRRRKASAEAASAESGAAEPQNAVSQGAEPKGAQPQGAAPQQPEQPGNADAQPGQSAQAGAPAQSGQPGQQAADQSGEQADGQSAAQGAAPATQEATSQPEKPAVQETAEVARAQQPADNAQEQQGAEPAAQDVNAAAQSARQESNAAGAQDEDPAIAQAREAREIMDRRRAAAHANAGQVSQQAGAGQAPQPSAAQAPQQAAADQSQRAGAAAQSLSQSQASTEVSGVEPSDQQPQSGNAQAENTEQRSVQPTGQPAEAPVEAAQSTDAPADTSAAATAPAGDAAQVDEQAWQKILEKVREHDLSAWIAGRDATLAAEQPTAGQIVVEHATGALAKFVNSDRNAPIYSKAAEEVLGAAHTVLATVGGNNPGKAQAGSAEEAPAESATPTSTTSGNNATGAEASHSTVSQPAVSQAEPGQVGPDHAAANQAPAVTAEPSSANAAGGHAPSEAAGSGQALGEGTSAGQDAPGEAAGFGQAAPTQATQPAQPAQPSAGASALERARRMAEASAAQATSPTPAPTRPSHTEEPKPQSGWRARAAKYAASREYKLANGFNGVPLPDEPPEDPWDSGPGGYPNGPAPGAGNAGPRPAGGAPQGGQPGGPHPAGQANNGGAFGGQGVDVPNQRTQPTDPEEALRRQQDEIMDDLATGEAGKRETRPALEIAGELIENILGGERTR